MRFPIDVAFLTDDLVVLKVVTMVPWRISAPVVRAHCVIEAEAGAFRSWGLTVGDRLDGPGVSGDHGDQVAHHVTMNGTHNHSTMPLLTGIEPTGAPIAWTYIHIWRTDGERVVEHWACRDDMGLLAQLEPSKAKA